MSPELKIYSMKPFPKPEREIVVPFPSRNYETGDETIKINYSGTREGEQIFAHISGIKDVPSLNVAISPKTGKGKGKFNHNQKELRVELTLKELEHLRQI
jgi:hypothetical protein